MPANAILKYLLYFSTKLAPRFPAVSQSYFEGWDTTARTCVLRQLTDKLGEFRRFRLETGKWIRFQILHQTKTE